MHGRILQVIRSMYTNLKSCVRKPEGLTEYFACEMGTRQGCILSPALFAFHIRELVDMLRAENCNGVYINEYFSNQIILLYADDICVGSDTVGRLQKIINVLFTYCKMWHLLVNMIKTKLVVFRRGGILKKNEKWYFGEEKIEIVPSIKYLGIVFSPTLKWYLTTNKLCSCANKALYSLYKYTYRERERKRSTFISPKSHGWETLAKIKKITAIARATQTGLGDYQ